MFENLDRRKLFLIGAIVAAVLVLGWLVNLWLSQPTPVQPPLNQNANRPGTFPVGVNGNANYSVPGSTGLPVVNGNINAPGTGAPPGSPVAAGGLTATKSLTTGPALAPTGGTGGTVRYYDAQDGKFYELGPGGTRQALADVSYPQVQQVIWSPKNTSAILEFPDGAKVLYDFTLHKQFTLPKQMTEFSFAPDGSKIAGKFLDDNPANAWITTVNPDGSGLTGIEPMGDNADKVEVAWAPNNQVVALSKTGDPAGLFQQNILLIGFHSENFRNLTVDGRGFDGQWTPDGNRLLYSVYSDKTDYRPMLWLADAATDRVGANKQALPLSTWVDKCTLAGSVAYCAVPKELPQGAGFSRELASGLPDYLYRVNLATGATALVAEPLGETGQGLTATNLTVSGDGSTLYFTDASGRLRSVKL